MESDMNLFDLSNKVAIVTGGNGGIGLGMARGLAKARATVVVATRNSKHLWLLATTLLVLVQPANSAEENMRKVGIVSSFSVDAALRSPGYKRFTDAIRASAPDLNISFEWRSAEG